MRKSIPIALIALALQGCDIPVPQADVVKGPSEKGPSRFTIAANARFYDSTACEERIIYVIQDKETGAEYIGITGVGISETGSHLRGKTSVRDER